MAATFGPSPAEAEVQSSSGSVTVEVVGTMGFGWTATTVADWVTISPASGTGSGYFTVSYTQNTDTDNSRVAIVDMVGDVGTAEFTLTQEAAPAPSGGNIFVGGEGITIMLGGDEIPAIYCGEELLYPISIGTLTGITLENITWVTDVPSSGGTATEENCSYKVVGHYDSGKSRTVTSKATVTGSLVVPATTAETREAVGTLELTATYEEFTASGTVTAYQEADVFVPTGYLQLNGVSGVTITTNFNPKTYYQNHSNYMRIEVNVNFGTKTSGNYLWNATSGSSWFSFEQGSSKYAYQNLGSSILLGRGSPAGKWNTSGLTYTDVFTYNNGSWMMQRTGGGANVSGTWSGTLGPTDLKFFTSSNCDYSFYRLKVFGSANSTTPDYDFCPDRATGNGVYQPCIYEAVNKTHHFPENSGRISFVSF